MDKPRELPLYVKNRQRIICDVGHCGGNIPDEFKMAAQCGTSCPNDGQIPSDWFSVGTFAQSLQSYYYYHFTDSTLTCLPCCTFESRNSRMPG